MVDISDFVIAYCPTNIYSVGTPHEIITARQQHKPVLFVSTPVKFPALDGLRKHLSDAGDKEGQRLLSQLIEQVPIKENPKETPSLINVNYFFPSATIISSVPQPPYRGADSGPVSSSFFLFLASSAR